jgi:dCTP deaminase
MAFWSSQRVELEQQKQKLIEPFDTKRIHQGAYELALSREALTTPDGTRDTAAPGIGPALIIPPGQFALLYTEERVTIPADAIAFLSIKASVKFKGLVNVSGFHVDPGFSSRLKFSVHNAGNKSICLNYGDPYFLIWFADLDAKTRDPYSGSQKNQDKLSPTDREQMAQGSQSPASLAQRLEKLERHVNLILVVTAIVIVPLLVGIGIALAQRWLEGVKSTEPQKSIQTNSSAVSLPQPSPAQPLPSTIRTQLPAAPLQPRPNPSP